MAQKMIQKKKKKQILPETIEWEEAVEEVADLLDVIDINMWTIGDIAKDIPNQSQTETQRNLILKIKIRSPLQQFAEEVTKVRKKTKNVKTTYEWISRARSLATSYEPKERVEDVPIKHHAIVAKHISEPEKRKEKLIEAKEKDWSSEKLEEEIAPKPMKFERTANDVADDILDEFSNMTNSVNEMIEDMNIADLTKDKANRLFTSEIVLIFKTFKKLNKQLIKKESKPDKRILELMKK